MKIETRAVDSTDNPKSVVLQLDQSGNLKIHASTSLDIDAQDIRIVATNRLEVKSPTIETTTNFNGEGSNDNCIVAKTDSFLLDTSQGTAMAINRHNGPHML